MSLMVERTRTKALNIRISDDEVTMLQALSEHSGLTQSDVVRQLVRKAFEELPKPKRKK